jgi:glycine dehydrogenase subunit 1
MLDAIGARSTAELFRGVPEAIRVHGLLDLPKTLTEPELRRDLERLGGKTPPPTFLGAGAYPHVVPAAIEQLLLRSELYTAYTPYQPEVAQGTLQSMFEFQTMVSELLGLPVANASMYDGASATGEAVLMALRIAKNKSKVVVSSAVHPEYRQVIRTVIESQGVDLVEVPRDPTSGGTDLGALEKAARGANVVVIQSPNFFGVVEQGKKIGAAVKAAGASLVVTVPEVMSLGLFEAPGAHGADIATGEGLGYGVGVQLGGPACGLFAAKQEYLRQMPGRLVGETVDSEGVRGYVLTLSTREQFIRREKATSNICTNQGLLALGFAMHMASLGKRGLVSAARQNLARALRVKERLAPLGFTPRFSGPHFNEVAYRVPKGSAQAVAQGALSKGGVIAGLPLGRFYGDLEDTLLVCTTEWHSPADVDRLVDALGKVVKG